MSLINLHLMLVTCGVNKIRLLDTNVAFEHVFEVPGLNLDQARTPVVMTDCFHSVLHSLESNSWIVSQIRPCHLVVVLTKRR